MLIFYNNNNNRMMFLVFITYYLSVCSLYFHSIKTFKNQKNNILILTGTNSSINENMYIKKLDKICISFTTIYQGYKNVMEDFIDIFTPFESIYNDNTMDSNMENILLENKIVVKEEYPNDYYSIDVKRNIYLFIDF